MDAATAEHVISQVGRVLDAEVAYRNQECQMGELPPIIYHHKPPLDESPRMSAIDRLKAKALEARDIAPQAIRDFEADLDGILAEKGKLAQRRAAAVDPHKETFSGLYSEFDGLKQAMDILSNGGPPLGKSETDVPSSLPPDGAKAD